MRRKLNSPNVVDVDVLPLSPEEMEHPRPIPRTVRIWAPDGHSEVHTRENAADLCRRPGPGQAPWSYSKPRAPEDPEPVERADDATIRARVRALTTKPAEPAGPTELQLLRDEATALGIVVEPTWGKKKLREEIASAKAGSVDTSAERVDDADMTF